MKRILVPIDFSDVTELVIENAKLFAKSFDSELRIIHVFAPMLEGTVGRIIMVPMNYEDLRDELAAELKNEHKKMLEIKQKMINEKVKVKAFLLGGKVSEVIFSQVKEYIPDMIIMGSHGHGHVAKALLGSITTSVLKHVKCPVIIVPSKSKK
jgi:nucleotide-binding universal stress UspA family protein